MQPSMNNRLERSTQLTRRHFLHTAQAGVGALAWAGLAGHGSAANGPPGSDDRPLAPRRPPLPARARSIIYLEMAGAPPQQDLFDYKPELVKLNMQPCPDELLKNQKFAFIKGHPKMLGTPHKFAQHGQGGTWISELLPNIARVADELAVIRSMNTDQFNHAPADLMLFTGSPPVRRGVDRIVAHLGARFRKPGAARFRRADQRRERPHRRQKRLGERLSAVGVSGGAVPVHRGTDSVRQ
jgi:hypothetical protein